MLGFLLLLLLLLLLLIKKKKKHFYVSLKIIESCNQLQLYFYVTDGNIMYLTDASRFLISCVIQHYAPVVGWGGGGTDA